MVLSFQRLKDCGPGDITLLFNGLDQLPSRFPLCAKEEIFVPGMIETLCAEQITSIFIGVKEPGQPDEQYGLLSMADLLLSFTRHEFFQVDYLAHIDNTQAFSQRLTQDELNGIKDTLGEHTTPIVLRVQRSAGGQAAGAGGILELVEENSSTKPLYGKNGLHFTAFSPRASQGNPIKE
jgi:hypothetical protein